MQITHTTIPLLGLDIRKNVHVYGTYRGEDLVPLHEPVKIYNNRVGFGQFAAHVQQLLAAYPTVKLVNEPTGIYYEAFGREIRQQFEAELTSGQLEYYLVSPHLVKEARTTLQRGCTRKTDAIDTQAIAHCIQQNRVMPAQFPDGQLLPELEGIVVPIADHQADLVRSSRLHRSNAQPNQELHRGFPFFARGGHVTGGFFGKRGQPAQRDRPVVPLFFRH